MKLFVFVKTENLKSFLSKAGFRLGLLTSGGEKWKARRRMLTPAFHFDILDKVLVTMMAQCKVALQRWDLCAEREEFVDIAHDMSLLGYSQYNFFFKGFKVP